MSGWQYQATGNETEIFDAADDNATPLALIPLLDSETLEDHQGRVRMVTAAPTANELLRECLNALNRIPNTRLVGVHSESTYVLAGKIDRYFEEVKNG